MENQTAANSTSGRLLLDGVPTLRRACDLDLLLFFARHPVSLLTSEQLAAFVGYDHDEVAESLERLSSAGIVTRTDRPAYVARRFVFAPGGAHGGGLSSLLQLASTREGRVALLQALPPDRGAARGPLAEAG